MASKFVTKCVSTFGTVNKKDLMRGLLLAMLNGAGTKIAFAQLTALPSLMEWKLAGTAALIGGLAYLGKQFFTGPPKA